MTGAAIGLRERKKQKTRESIQREAMRLFQEQGYEETTIEQIAEAADISPSTFFNYFPTKEDVILYDRYDPMMLRMVDAGPADELPSAAIRRLLQGLGPVFERDREIIFARARLGMQVPALRGRFWEELQRTQDMICMLFAARSGRDPHDFELRVVALTIVAAGMEACLEWLRNDGRGNLMDLVIRAFDLVGAGERLDAIVSRAPA